MNRCTTERKKECIIASGELINLVCSQCSAKEEYEPSAWFNHIWFLYSLQVAGYPFAKDDLTVEEWLDLGILKAELERLQWQMKQK